MTKERLGTLVAVSKGMKARTCEGCGKPMGCIPIAGKGYWHLPCWRKAIAKAKRVQP